MTLNALCLHFLKHLSLQKEAISTGYIKSRMLGNHISGDAIIEELKNRGFASVDDNRLKITNTGKSFFETLENTELEKIQALVFDDYDLALIDFLFNRNDFVNLEDFPIILKECAPQHKNSVNDGNLIQSLFRLRRYIDEQNHWYIINDIGKAYYKNKIGKHNSDNETSSEMNGFEKRKLTIPSLTESERLWLTELYQLAKSGKKFTYRELWTKLSGKLPRNFKTAAVNEKLISSNGEKIHVLGVVAVEKDFQIIHKINKIVNSVRDIILKDETKHSITIDEIGAVCELTSKEVSFSLELARFYVNLYSGCSFKENSTELISIDVSGSEAIFYNYLHFEGIEFYLTNSAGNTNSDSRDYFSPDDISAINEKLDNLIEEMKKVVLSHEFTYNDVMEELEELKSLYGLKKKNWKRLLVAKLTDMTAGGLVSSIIADPLADIIKPEINKLLTQ